MKTTLTVKDISFVTNFAGNIVPLFYIEKNKELADAGIDINGIIFDNHAMLRDGYGVGSKMAVKFDEHGQPDVQALLGAATSIPDAPINCPTCEHATVKNGVDVWCPNEFCPATSRGFIYRLFQGLTKADISEVTSMLEGYPMGGPHPAVIDTLESFKIAFDSVQHKNTQSRINHWTGVFPEKVALRYWQIELELAGALEMPKLRRSLFWSVCNFKHLTMTDFEALCTVDPHRLLAGEENRYNELTDRSKELLEHNMGFVKWLVDYFDSYGEKKWTN